MKIPARAYAQYRTKPKFMAWLNIAHEMGGSIEAAAEAVRRSYDIDTAEGEQLDVIGRIVVIDRGFISNIPLGQYMCTPDSMEQPQCGDSDVMCSQASVASDSVMSDALFRIAIKAKIAKNNGDATIPAILAQMKLMLPGATYLRVIDNQDMTFDIEYGGKFTDLERWALLNVDLIQRPHGVKLNGFVEKFDIIQFGDPTKQFGGEDVQFAALPGA